MCYQKGNYLVNYDATKIGPVDPESSPDFCFFWLPTGQKK